MVLAPAPNSYMKWRCSQNAGCKWSCLKAPEEAVWGLAEEGEMEAAS